METDVEKENESRGSPFGPVFYVSLSAVLALFKAVGAIDWSWWIVTAPIWVPMMVYGTGLFVFCIAVLWLSYIVHGPDDEKV